jgi:hypothetical protein
MVANSLCRKGCQDVITDIQQQPVGLVPAGYGFLQRLEPLTATLLLVRWKLDLATTARNWNQPLELLLDHPALLSMRAATEKRSG